MISIFSCCYRIKPNYKINKLQLLEGSKFDNLESESFTREGELKDVFLTSPISYHSYV
jgi:hypothetical protein